MKEVWNKLFIHKETDCKNGEHFWSTIICNDKKRCMNYEVVVKKPLNTPPLTKTPI